MITFNKKCKFIAIILTILMISCVFLGCNLVSYPQEENENNKNKLEITDDYLVGMLLYVLKHNEEDYTTYPSENLDDEDSIYLYFAQLEDEDGHIYNTLKVNGYLFDTFTGITNSGANVNEQNPYGKIEVSATFSYTYELLGSVLYIDNVYKVNGEFEYYTQDGSIGMALNSFGKGSQSSSQTLTASKTINNEKTEIKYEGKWTINIDFIDYLVGAKVIEFDDNHSILNSYVASLEDENLNVFTMSENCSYVIIEEEYKVMHDNHNKYSKGEKYTKRYFVDKSEFNKYHYLKVPLGNGFVNPIGLDILSASYQQN